MNTEPKYPEHEKLAAIKEKSQAQGEFLEWLYDSRQMRLGFLDEDTGDLFPSYTSIRDLLAEFHKIDQRALEEEKHAMLDEIRGARVATVTPE